MRPALVQWLSNAGAGSWSFLVPTVGLMYALAVGSVLFLFVHRARRLGVDDIAKPAALVAAFGAMLGTRLFWLLITGGFRTLPPRTWFSFTGTASWGAYLGAAAGLFLFLRVRRERVLPYFDLAASCTALGIFFGRLGCFLNGDDFGRLSSVPWAVSYPVGSLPYDAQRAAGFLPAGAAHSLATHPFQIYLSLNGLMVFLLASAVWRRHHSRPGVTLTAYLLADGATRFALESLRDPAAGGSDLLSVSQGMCLIALAIAALVVVVQRPRWSSMASTGLHSAGAH